MKVIASFIFIVVSVSITVAQVASGGQFTLTQSVIANGGNAMQGGQIKVTGTAGQSVAGQKVFGQTFAEIAGFWIPDDLQTTAAHVSLTGRVATADGRGISRVRITMAGADGV